MHILRSARAVGAGLALAFAISGTAFAASPTREFAPAPDEFPLDGVCAFSVVVHVAVNGEYATTFVDPAGNPIRMRINGRLKVDVVRPDTGASVPVNASGPASIDLTTGELTAYGHFLQWGPGIDGLVLFRGQHAADGTGSGSAVDVCAMLA